MLGLSPFSKLTKQVIAKPQSRKISQFLYSTVWRKSNILYITYVVIGCVAAEVIYGGATNALWESYNQGKLYHQIDWSKFKVEDDEE